MRACDLIAPAVMGCMHACMRAHLIAPAVVRCMHACVCATDSPCGGGVHACMHACV